MQNWGTQSLFAPRLVDSLYVEAMVLADEVRGYFDRAGPAERDLLPPLARVTFSCESLKITTRLMHIVAWLLTRRAIDAGEIPPGPGRDAARRLGLAADSDPATYAALPEPARLLIEASRELYGRVERLDQDMDDEAAPPPSPARGLMSRLERAF
jgi:regulator of CtrA degradation